MYTNKISSNTDVSNKKIINDTDKLKPFNIANNIMECKWCQERFNEHLKNHCTSIMYERTKSSLFKRNELLNLHDDQNFNLCSKCIKDNEKIMEFHFKTHSNLDCIIKLHKIDRKNLNEMKTTRDFKQDFCDVPLTCDNEHTKTQGKSLA